MTKPLAESEMKVYEVPISEIFCDDEFNCRGYIPPIDVVDLARSIEDNGLLEAITIQPFDRHKPHKYRIVSGHRRFNAFKVLKRLTIPSVIKDGLSELMARKLNFEENLKRKNLNLLQEAKALHPFASAGWTQEEMASQFNQSRGWIQARCALLELPEEIQQAAAAGFLTQEHVKQLKTIKSKADQFEAVKKIKASKMLGEKKKIRAVPKKTHPLTKRKREREEIFTMMEMFMGVIGPSFYSRCMAWAAGEVSDFELMREFKDFAKDEYGKDWTIPSNIYQDALT